MFNSRQAELEARVARLERLLGQVLELIQDLKADKAGQPTGQPTGKTEGRPSGPPRADRPSVFRTGPGGGPGEATGAPRAGAMWSDTPGPGRTDPSGYLPVLTRLGVWPLTEVFLSRLGIAILLLAVAYFFKYSIDQGWLIPAIRLGIGVVAGAALLAMGFKGASKGEPIGTALAGGGIATFFITGFAGHQWYSLVSYPVAFGFLFAASALGIYLSLRSGRQALSIVGLIGALATPLLLTSQTTEVAGLALYVCLIVASVGGIYLARAWRAVFLLAAVTSWMVLSLAVSQGGSLLSSSLWFVQGGIAFCGLVFWLAPLLRAELRAGNPPKWPRPEGSTDEVPWSAHLDALSLLMPVVAIFLTGWLWDLSRGQLGWVFSGVAILAYGVGFGISKSRNPEDSASTQWFVALLLATVGLGLLLRGDVLYLAFIAEAVALVIVGSRKESGVVLGLGIGMEVVVLALFVSRLLFGETLLEGDLSSIFDLAAIAAAAFLGSRLDDSRGRRGFFFGAYLGFLLWTGRELEPFRQGQALMSLAFGLEGTAVLVAGFFMNRSLLQKVGMATLLLVVAKVLLVDLAAVEPIWRVLLLFIFGGLFLLLSKFVQSRRGVGPKK